MNKKEIMEIKRRLKKEGCSITRIAGCYVNSSKEKVTTFSENFLNLEDEEFHKYLEIANKVLSGTVGDHLLELHYETEDELKADSKQQSLLLLRNSGLKDEGMLESFYDHIIESYDNLGNYLILLFHDVYDIPVKTNDEMKLGDSDEVFDYILCAICPVNLAKPGLAYREDENRIGALIRDWVVAAVDTGFCFPCFSERSADVHSVLVYSKDAKEPHKEFWENGLGVTSVYTMTEKRNAFTNIMAQTLGENDEETPEKILDVQIALNEHLIYEAERHEKDEPIFIQPEDVADILEESGIAPEPAEKITKKYEEFFQEEVPEGCELLDTKALKANEGRVEKKQLKEQIVNLTNQLVEAGVMTKDGENVEVVVKVDDKRAAEITTAFVDGKKCLVIPIDGADAMTINGEKKNF